MAPIATFDPSSRLSSGIGCELEEVVIRCCTVPSPIGLLRSGQRRGKAVCRKDEFSLVRAFIRGSNWTLEKVVWSVHVSVMVAIVEVEGIVVVAIMVVVVVMLLVMGVVSVDQVEAVSAHADVAANAIQASTDALCTAGRTEDLTTHCSIVRVFV
jgi:hypothetical protein